MISLLLTLFISMLSIGSSINRLEEYSESRISTISNESLILQESKPVNNAFIYEDYDGEGEGNYCFVISFNEMSTTNAFLDIRDYFKQYGNYSIDDDNSIMPVNTSYILPIQPCDIRTFYNFDYAAGYPFLMEYVRTLQRIRVTKYLTANKNSFYYVDLLTASSDSESQGVRFTLRKTLNFDYVISENISVFGGGQSNDYVISGVSNTGINPSYLCLFELFKSISDRYMERGSYEKGYTLGYEQGSSSGYSTGYQVGYNDGLSNADYDSTAMTIFTGITSIAMVPINMFLQIFNFEILGINISGFISGILTVAVVVIIIRLITGGKNND